MAKPEILDSYDRLIAQCITANDINRVHIAFGNTMTPAEVLYLEENLFRVGRHRPGPIRPDARFTVDDLKKFAREWIDDTRNDLKPVGKPRVEPFLRKDIRKSVTLFHSGDRPHGRSLLIALAGANHRFMMPVATLLQNLPAADLDVLVIRDGTRSGYTAGLEGLAPSIEELGAALPKVFDVSGYRRLLGLGVSAGGLPIIFLAMQMDFESVLACGPSGPSREKWQRPGFPSPVDTLLAAAREGKANRITIAYGAQSEKDRVSAEEIAGYVAINPVEVAIPGRDVRHNVLHPLHLIGKLPEFFAKHLAI